MPRIYVEYHKLRQFEEKCRITSSKTASIHSEFQGIINHLDWDVKYAADINNTANRIVRKLEAYIQDLGRYQSFLADAAEQYERLDSEKLDTKNIDIVMLSQEETARTFTDKSGLGLMVEDFLNGVNEKEELLSKLKTYLKISDKLGAAKVNGVLSKAVSYLEDFAKFFTGDMKGLTGAADLCKLTNSSSDLWEKAYSYFQKMYDGLNDGFFGKVAQRNVAGVALLGNVVGFLGKIASVNSGIDEKNGHEVAVGYVDVVGKTGDVTKSFNDLHKANKAVAAMRAGKAADVLSIGSGVWNPADIYLSIFNGGVEMVSQGIKSHEKYSADSKWDLGDTGATLIDVSVAGFHGIINKLTFGLDDLILNSMGLNAEKIADGIKDWSAETGKKLGYWILDFQKDPGGTCIKTALSGIHGIVSKATFGLNDVIFSAFAK